MWCITLIDLWILKNPCIPGIKPTFNNNKTSFPFFCYLILQGYFFHLKKKKNRFSCCWLSLCLLSTSLTAALGTFVQGLGLGVSAQKQWREGNVGRLALVSLLLSQPRVVHPVIWQQVNKDLSSKKQDEIWRDMKNSILGRSILWKDRRSHAIPVDLKLLVTVGQ